VSARFGAVQPLPDAAHLQGDGCQARRLGVADRFTVDPWQGDCRAGLGRLRNAAGGRDERFFKIPGRQFFGRAQADQQQPPRGEPRHVGQQVRFGELAGEVARVNQSGDGSAESFVKIGQG